MYDNFDYHDEIYDAMWTMAGPEGAVERFGADAAYPYPELAKRLPDLLQGFRNLHYRFADDHSRDLMLIGALKSARRKARRRKPGRRA